MGKINKKWFFVLQIALFVYSSSGIFSKSASQFEVMSIPFLLCYGAMILILGIYAILWQQIIKHLPLTLAFSNKAVTIVWGMFLGAIIYKEVFSIKQIVGAIIIIIGVISYMNADKEMLDV